MRLKIEYAKITTLVVLMMVTTFSPIKGFAKDKADQKLPVLTLKQAISSAQSADGLQQEVYHKNIMAKEQMVLDTEDVATNAYQGNYYSKLDEELTASYHKDAVAYHTSTLYNQIVLQHKQLALCDEQLVYDEKVYNQIMTQYHLGLASKIQYETAQSNIENQRTAKQKIQAALEENEANFKQLTQYDPKNYTLEEHLEVEYYDFVGNIQYHFKTVVGEMLQYKQKAAEMADKYAVNDLFNMGRPIEATTYYSTKAQTAAQLNQVEIMRDNYMTRLNAIYSALVTGEQDIKETEVALSDAKRNLEVNKVRYEKGYISQRDIDQAEIQLKQLENKLIGLKISYNINKEAIKKPWVSFY